MKATLVSLLVFIVIFGAAYLATLLRARLPEHHLSADTKDTMKLTMGLVATMTALVLGLLVASAKGTYDAERSGIITMSAKIVLLDRMLEHYGPDSLPARQVLRLSMQEMIDHLWPETRAEQVRLDPSNSVGETLYDVIQKLKPTTESQQFHKTLAMNAAVDLGQSRWLLYEQSNSAISPTLLGVVVCWLAVLLFSFGLFAPPNRTALIALMVSAFSVSAAIFLILELDQPFGGIIKIPSASAESALAHLGR